MPAPATARCWRRARRSTSWRCATATDFAGATQARALGETIDDQRRRASPSIRPAMCSARRRSRSSMAACASSPPATTSASRTRPARPSSRSPATSSSPRRPSACRCSAIRRTRDEIARLLKSAQQFPERAHLVGAYALGKAQRVIRLLRDAGYDKPIYIHGALAKLCDYYQSQGIDLGDLRAGDRRGRRARAISPARSSSARRRPSPTAGRGAFPIRSPASPPAGCASASAPSRAASSCR